MATIKSGFIAFCIVLFGYNAISQSSVNSFSQSRKDAVKDFSQRRKDAKEDEANASPNNCLKLTYDSQIGVREISGKNDGKEVEMYLASCKLGKGNAWCAAFVNWCMIECGVETGVKSAGWSPSWFVGNVIYSRNPSPTLPKGKGDSPEQGDVFGIWFENKGRIAHVGFIDEWDEANASPNSSGKYCITVEANTNEAGSREGDGVYRKRRLKGQIYKVSRYTKKD